MNVPTTRYDILNLLPPGPVVGVEIGTDVGINARELLQQRPDLFLWTVDPWQVTRDYPEVGRGTALHFYKKAMDEFIKAGRARHLRLTSVDAAAVLKSQGVRPDFVYVDGDHSEPAVRLDLATWYPLLRPGGLLAGHDFEAHEVHTPVIQFCKFNRLDLGIINEHGGLEDMGDTPGSGYDRHGGWAHPSWYFFKPDAAGYMNRFLFLLTASVGQVMADGGAENAVLRELNLELADLNDLAVGDRLARIVDALANVKDLSRRNKLAWHVFGPGATDVMRRRGLALVEGRDAKEGGKDT